MIGVARAMRVRCAAWHLVLIVTGVGATGCAARREDVSSRSQPPPKPAALRIHLARETPWPGWEEVTDQAGQKVYVSPVVELDNADVVEARAAHGLRRSIVQLELTPVAGRRFHDLTEQNRGALLAVFIDDGLLCTQPIRGPVPGGLVPIVGKFSRGEAEALAARLNCR